MKKTLVTACISLVMAAGLLAGCASSSAAPVPSSTSPQGTEDPSAPQVSSDGQNSPPPSGQPGQGGFRGGQQLPDSGTVTALDSSSVTIQDGSGNSTTYTVAPDSQITKEGDAALAVGDSVRFSVKSDAANTIDRLVAGDIQGGGAPGNLTQDQQEQYDSAYASSLKTELDKLVTAGTITQDIEDQIRASSSSAPPSPLPSSSPSPFVPGDLSGLNLTSDQMASVQQAMTNARKDALDSLVSAGVITQDQEDQMLQARGNGGGFNPRGGDGPAPTAGGNSAAGNAGSDV